MSRVERSTEILHSDYVPPAGFGSLTTPIHHASTITFQDVESMRARDWRRSDGYTYGLHGTPTTFTLEERIAVLEGGRHTILAPSGLAAIALINLSLLTAGDMVLLPANVYGPNRDMCRSLLGQWGITAVFYDPVLGAGIAALITDKTRLLWIESPGSVTMEVGDLPALVAAAQSRGVTTALDNTWSGGLLLRPFDFGVDIVMQALTKYPSGGSDVLMGSVTTRELALYEKLKLGHMHLGYGVSADDAYLVLRGLASLEVRLRQHEESALTLAHWLKGRPEVARVLHPALPDCPGHVFWKRDFLGSGGLFSFVLEPSISQARVDAMVNALRLFKIGFSWGGAVSLAVPYIMGHSRPDVPWNGSPLVRLYVGLERAADLIDDLNQAFQNL